MKQAKSSELSHWLAGVVRCLSLSLSPLKTFCLSKAYINISMQDLWANAAPMTLWWPKMNHSYWLITLFHSVRVLCPIFSALVKNFTPRERDLKKKKLPNILKIKLGFQMDETKRTQYRSHDINFCRISKFCDVTKDSFNCVQILVWSSNPNMTSPFT